MQTFVKTWISSPTEELPSTPATLPARAPVIEISGFKKAVNRSGFKSIDEVIDNFSSEPGNRSEIESARRWVADSFHSKESNSLRVLRLRKGLSQAELAKLIETKQAHIARIEAGNNVEVETLVKLAQALDVDPVTLFSAFFKQYELARK